MDALSILQESEKSFFSQFQKTYNSLLESRVSIANDALERLKKSSGKHMRPTILALSNRLAGGEAGEEAACMASVIELLHTASLIHDDVIDNSTLRRGKETLNAIYNNHIAVLVGDLLLTTVFDYGLNHFSKDILQIVARTGRSLCEGELQQLAESQHTERLSIARYNEIIYHKTASLFEASAALGGMIAVASPEVLGKLFSIGKCIGMAFQIKDDMLDYVGDEKTGKPLGNDLVEGKVTLPLLVLLERADSAAYAKLMQRIEDSRSDLTVRNELIAYTIQNGGIDYAKNRMLEYVSQAKQLLASFEESRARNQMIDLLDWMVQRSY